MTAYEHEAGLLPELEGESEYEAEWAGEYETLPGPVAAAAARAALQAVAGEFEGAGEYELNPTRRWYPDAMLEHLAHEASQAETEDEAGEKFLPLIPLIAAKLLPLAAKAAPLIAKAMPKVVNVVSRVTPHLTRGVMNVARTMFRSPATRRFLRVLPSIAQRTVGQIARQVAAGRPVTPQTAVRTLARQTMTVMNQPGRVNRSIARSVAMDRQLHQTLPRSVAPTVRPRPTGGCGTVRVAPRSGCRCGGCRSCGCRCGGCGCR